jgi:hypothetical protein
MYFADRIKEDEMGRAYSTYMGEMKKGYKSLL